MTKPTRRLSSGLFVAAAIAGLIACDNGAVTEPSTDPTPFPAALQVAGGDGQSVTVGTAADTLLTVRVLDKNGQPYEGDVQVIWSVDDERAALAIPRTPISSDGTSSNAVTMGMRSGPVVVRAAVEGSAAEEAVFNLIALPGAPTKLVPATGTVGIPGTRLPVGVQVQDAFGNGVPGQSVAWSGAGVVAASSTTDADGIATTQIDLPASPSMVEVTAQSGELSRTLSVRAADIQMQLIAGATQTTEIGEPWPTELEVRVTDAALNNQPIAGVIVGWAATKGSPTLAALTSTTDADGVARMQVTAGSKVAREEVRAQIGGAEAVFTAEVTGPNGAWMWQKVNGEDQHGRAGTPLPEPFSVQVLDTRGVPVAGVEVFWTKRDGSKGTIGARSSITDATGVATVAATLGLAQQDTLIVYATIPAFADTLEFRAVATSDGKPFYLEKDTLVDAQQGTSLNFLANPLRVQVLDFDRHPVEGALVKWRIHDGSGNSCSYCGALGQSGNVTSQSYTDENGWAIMEWQLGPKTGPQYVEAYVPGLSPDETEQFIAFATSLHVPADIIALGEGFSTIRGTQVPEPLRVLVVDSVRSPVAGVAVSWAVELGDGVIQYASTVTDETGVAENYFSVLTSGSNRVKASLEMIGESVTFDVRGTWEPDLIQILDGEHQSVIANPEYVENGVAFSNPLRIRVLDRDGVPVKNALVVVTATQGGGGVSIDGQEFSASIDVLTDYNGEVAVLRTANEIGDVRTSFVLKGTFKSVTMHGQVN